MGTGMWDEIHGFQSLDEYRRFVHYIEGQVQAGHLKEVLSEPEYQKGQIFGGRWFQDIDSGKTWRLGPPDFPFRGIWEPVDVNK